MSYYNQQIANETLITSPLHCTLAFQLQTWHSKSHYTSAIPSTQDSYNNTQ